MDSGQPRKGLGRNKGMDGGLGTDSFNMKAKCYRDIMHGVCTQCMCTTLFDAWLSHPLPQKTTDCKTQFPHVLLEPWARGQLTLGRPTFS